MNEEAEHTSEQSAQPPVRWWRPGWRDVASAVGWPRLVLIIAAAAIGTILAAFLLVAGLTFTVLLLKPVLLLAGGGIAFTGYLVRLSIQARREPFCVFCGYCLVGLPDHYRCPECGRPYSWQQIDEYRRDPQWFIARWKARQELPPADPPVDTGPARPRRRSRDGTD